MSRVLALLLALCALVLPSIARAHARVDVPARASGAVVAGAESRVGSPEFLQRDPEGYLDSVNQYAAMANDPINNRDPTGRVTDGGGAAGFVGALMYDERELELNAKICATPGMQLDSWCAGLMSGMRAKPVLAAAPSAAAAISDGQWGAASLLLLGTLGVVASDDGDGKKPSPQPPDAPNEKKPLAGWLPDEPELLNEARREHAARPDWQGIDPDSTPVYLRPRDEVEEIRKKPGESGGHHPHGLALGGPEGQRLTTTGDTRDKVNPDHARASGLQRRLINAIKKRKK